MDTVDIEGFLERGLGVLIATRDEHRAPLCVSGAALELTGPGRAVVFIPEYECGQAFRNLSANGAIAVLIEQPTTHLGLQLKGQVSEVRDPTPAEDVRVRAFVARTLDEYAAIGIAPATIERLVFAPCRAVAFAFTDVFEQTPGPGAGRAVRAR